MIIILQNGKIYRDFIETSKTSGGGVVFYVANQNKYVNVDMIENQMLLNTYG